MNSSVSPANVVHEAIDERQYVRTKIPARVLLDGNGLKQLECEIQDISLGGLGLIYDQPLTLGSLFNASIKLKLNKIDLNIDAKVKIVSQRGHEVGAEFIELDRQKRDILRYIISAYMSGEIADINGLFNVMQRENYIKERKQKHSSSRSAGDRFKAVLGTLLFLALGLAAVGLIAYKSYLLFFRVQAAQAIVSANAYVVAMPDNGYVKYLLAPDQAQVKVGEPVASVSSQLAATFTTPSDIQALANLSQTDLQLLMGRALIETVIASPCDCEVFFPGQKLDGYAYKYAPLMHLLPRDESLFVKATIPFDQLDKMSRVDSVRMQVLGIEEPINGSVVSSSVDEQNQTLILTIKPDRELPRDAYQKPVSVDLFLGLPMIAQF
ncbi:PilZ domain-containing protein [Pseudomonas sp. G34]|uniref:PilZ domain-containing protein n=1 Tax=Pseudomonas sp. G34 TaxID=3059083 RepID=UPI0028094BC1|nr:PilZ domain-containing protein [Pseudomonas sp. G34]MDQ7983409.1 PilZ domain-containing protein [Pseudomonas sp. G34]